jgi:molybdopterin-guanine dinucleotide biosynthesis protein MobB
MSTPIVFGVYGPSDSGKTTLIVNLITHLIREGYRVATVKCTKKSLSLDAKGKDTWRHHTSGAELVVFSSASETDFMVNTTMAMPEIERMIASFGDYDLVLVEGANDSDIPKIQVGAGRKRKHTVVLYQNNFNEIVRIIKREVKANQPHQRLTITVNGKNIPLTEFPEHILTNTIVGMLSSLKGVRTIKEVTINIKP